MLGDPSTNSGKTIYDGIQHRLKIIQMVKLCYETLKQTTDSSSVNGNINLNATSCE